MKNLYQTNMKDYYAIVNSTKIADYYATKQNLSGAKTASGASAQTVAPHPTTASINQQGVGNGSQADIDKVILIGLAIIVVGVAVYLIVQETSRHEEKREESE